MLRLICFEWEKIWRKRSFFLAACILFAIHGFFLWYTLPSGEGLVPLSAYRSLQRELAGMSEEEKAACLAEWNQTAEGVSFVESVLILQRFENEQTQMLAAQELKNHPGVFEAYYGLYESGEWIRFTDSPEQEKTLIEEVYGELERTRGYGEWIRSVRENGERLGGISIFGGGEENGFSGRNLRRSAADYVRLDEEGICFTPSAGLVRAMESPRTDLFLVLSILFFAGSLTAEEKEKRLFYITRSTGRGVLHCMSAKLTALFLHCVSMTVVFYGGSLVFYGGAAGLPDFGSRLQSLAPYLESPLLISVGGYVFLSLLTKAFVLFGMGALAACCGIRYELTLAPWLFGVSVDGAGAVLYALIPGGTVLAPLKILNPVGLMRTEALYGGYLNLNLFGYPVPRLYLALGMTAVLVGAGVIGSLFLFARMRRLDGRRLRLPFVLPFRPHAGLLRYEAYKILIVEQGLVIWLLSAVLIGWRNLDQSYHPTAGEQYYRELMLGLEGELTAEKEQLILAQQERFEEALCVVEEIERHYEEGEISREAADAMESEARITLYFYPSFQRVQEQYLHCKEQGGSFVYDTGWLYFFGVWDDPSAGNLLIQSIGMILAVSGVFCVEYETGAILLLCCVQTGLRRTAGRKILICLGMGIALAAVAPLCRAIRISSVYPMGSILTDLRNIPYFSGIGFSMPILLAAVLLVLGWMGMAAITSCVTLLLSERGRSRLQTVFLALLLGAAAGLLYSLL